jgi:hypothetical protein
VFLHDAGIVHFLCIAEYLSDVAFDVFPRPSTLWHFKVIFDECVEAVKHLALVPGLVVGPR